MFDARDSHEKNSSNYRYVPINTPTKFEDSIGFESSGKATSTGLPDMDFEEEDCLPPLPNNYGTFSKKNSRMRAVISRLPDGTVPPYRAVFLVTNAAFGAGILNLPQAYMNAGGLQTAITVQVVRNSTVKYSTLNLSCYASPLLAYTHFSYKLTTQLGCLPFKKFEGSSTNNVYPSFMVESV